MKIKLLVLSFLLIAVNAFGETTYIHRYSNVSNLSQYEIVAHYDNGTGAVSDVSNENEWLAQGHSVVKESGNRFILINGDTVSLDPNMSSILAAEAQAAADAAAAAQESQATTLVPYVVPPVVTEITPTLSAKEPANSNIQAHVTSAHAPANAQKNSDITKEEIEAKLTGEISSHTHVGGSGAAWGGITGTLSNQTDLNSALAAKQTTLTRNTGLIVHADLANGTTAMAFGTNSSVKVTPTATATYTTTVPAAGCVAYLKILTSGTTSYTITFGSGFKSTGTLATGTVTAKVFTLMFISDGTTLNQIARSTAM